MLRRSLSSVNTRCKLRRGFAGTGRFVAAPGRDGAPEKLADFDNLGLGGDTTTGPPNLRLMVAQRSGSRAEKLYMLDISIRETLKNLQRSYDFNAKVSENIIRLT
jgi:hypothetical protein